MARLSLRDSWDSVTLRVLFSSKGGSEVRLPITANDPRADDEFPALNDRPPAELLFLLPSNALG